MTLKRFIKGFSKLIDFIGRIVLITLPISVLTNFVMIVSLAVALVSINGGVVNSDLINSMSLTLFLESINIICYFYHIFKLESRGVK